MTWIIFGFGVLCGSAGILWLLAALSLLNDGRHGDFSKNWKPPIRRGWNEW